MNNPEATILMKNGNQIVIELYPQKAPNTVNSFIYAAMHGIFDGHAIERIVPGSWVDFSYSAFGKEEAKYLIPLEFSQIPVEDGYIAMGGYGDLGIAGCEIFFPLRKCPEFNGKYPAFGKVLEGMEELYRLEKTKTVPIDTHPGIEIHKPVEPQIVQNVRLELYGHLYPPPVRVAHHQLPDSWK
ncbi:MAG TPA: peptidylprolyl isomerase [Lachnospiraceae bacterium]|nr:peptidylprolyl isomerase [Lachnospiraceae bacterium]